ncbi:MAG: tetratricopeptide repeat protein [Bacteroidia bacterium]
MSKAKNKAKIPRQTAAINGRGSFTGMDHPFTGMVLALCAFVLYANTTGGDYALDDWGAITGNPYVKEGFSGIGKIFSSDFWHITNIHLGYYRPLAPATFAIEQQFFQGNPHVSHCINALLFAFSAFVLYRLLKKIFSAYPALPFIATLLFIAHPIHTEVVANIKGRDELLSCLNTLLALNFGLKYRERKKTPHLLLALLFLYLALLSKESGLIIVILLPLFLYYKNNTLKESLVSALPFAGVVILFFIQKSYALGDSSTIIPDDLVNYPYAAGDAAPATTVFLFLFSLRLLILPHPLRYDYSYNQIPAYSWNSGLVLIGVLIGAGLLFLTFRQLQRRTVWGFALAFFFITLIPGLAFTFLRGGIFAERFLFMPSLGFCIILAYALLLLAKTASWKNIRLAVPLVIIFILYSVKTVSRNFTWKDNYTLMSTDVLTGQKSAQNQRHYGDQLINKANTEKPEIKIKLARESIIAFQKALRIYPKFGDAWCEMGIAYHTLLGNIDSAVYCYNKAIECAPGLEKAYYYLGSIYENNMNKTNVASFYYNEAIRQNPEFADAQVAADRLKKAGFDVHLNPLTATVDSTSAVKDEQYYFKMGNYLASQGDYAKAAENFASSIALRKDNEDAYMNLANCYGMLKQYEKSLAVAKEFLAMHPDNAKILKNMSVTYNFLGNKEESDRCLRRARELLGE